MVMAAFSASSKLALVAGLPVLAPRESLSSLSPAHVPCSDSRLRGWTGLRLAEDAQRKRERGSFCAGGSEKVSASGKQQALVSAVLIEANKLTEGSSQPWNAGEHSSAAAAGRGDFAGGATSAGGNVNGKDSDSGLNISGTESSNEAIAVESRAADHAGCSTSGRIQVDDLWLAIRAEARRDAEAEPALASYLYSTVLSHRSLERCLAFHLANKLSSDTMLSSQLFSLIADTFMDDKDVREAFRADLMAVKERDPACETFSQCLLNYKGYLACQAHRIAHRLWGQGREPLALALQSRVSEVFHVDIHPAAKLGCGLMLDHATGLVVGETAEIGNNVSILHHVTLGGTGSVAGNRHPKVEDGVLIGAGATLLGNIVIGEGAKIGAGSVVLGDVPPHTTVVGNPAKLVGGKSNPKHLEETPSKTMDHTSFLKEWSNYVI